ALAGALACTPAIAQQKVPASGSLYAFHTGRIDKCPGLDWHIVVQPDHTLEGFVGWDNMRHIATLKGTVQKDGTFKMNAKEVGGAGRTAAITGTAAGEYIYAAIEGSGSACDGKLLYVPRAVGGGSGGGGT
ncbi:MAG: hypothetical protein B7Z80_05975, partial [Rhodospirillales bacterium 20-64-7]